MSLIHHIFHRALQQLRECHESLCTSRLSILQGVVSSSAELTADCALIAKMRQASPYLLRMCHLEYNLFCSFFDPAFRVAPLVASEAREDAYTALIRGCCEGFYDAVRPLVIQQKDIDLLCECIRVVEGEILEAQIAASAAGVEALRSIVEQVLHDLQERLFYCTSLHIQENILGFQPSKEDLDYPRKLQRAVAAAQQQDESKGSSHHEGQRKKGSEQELMYVGWFKAVEETLMCLSKVFRCIEPQTFDEITQEAIAACTSCLARASEVIAREQSRLDGDLFLVKHLLILREQITPFNSALRVKQKHLDYKPTFDAFADFLAHSRQMFAMNRQNPLIELFARGVPRIAEDEVDCKKDLEARLRDACDAFILRAYQTTLVTLVPFLQRAVTVTVTPTDSKDTAVPTPLPEVDFAKPAKVLALLKQNQESIPRALARISQQMAVYLVNEQTHAILFQPIKTNVFARLTELSAIINQHYKEAEEFNQMVQIVSDMRAAAADVGTLPAPQIIPDEAEAESTPKAAESGGAEDVTDTQPAEEQLEKQTGDEKAEVGAEG